MGEITLEGDKTQAEVATPTPEKEVVEPTELKETPTVRTYSQDEFDTAVGKGLVSINQQLSLSKAEASKANADVEATKADFGAIEAELQDLQKQHDDLVGKQFAEDPEARQAYVDRRAIADERRKLTKDKVDVEKKLYTAELKEWKVTMATRARGLMEETGIPLEEIENCQTEAEMEVKALRFKLTKAPEVKEPKFDSVVSSGGGQEGRGSSPDETLQRAFRKLKSK